MFTFANGDGLKTVEGGLIALKCQNFSPEIARRKKNDHCFDSTAINFNEILAYADGTRGCRRVKRLFAFRSGCATFIY